MKHDEFFRLFNENEEVKKNIYSVDLNRIRKEDISNLEEVASSAPGTVARFSNGRTHILTQQDIECARSTINSLRQELGDG